ncbi:MAG: thiamine phosphate synthase [Candidatus Syntrophonatronum acetioxidans]|uniref:Thiamine-phosphate synthase n=1 Tax=Candidatus Syntrophonatronum acetioxidans TaxID=1795816 RepID=A0A424YIC2_9FIRM|nr:MAG: thiamine phosphate synthase [Candidatus Syntrophonatronum acetioxidans]
MKDFQLKLYVITNPQLSRGRSHQEVVSRALEGGARTVQLRDKELSARELLEEGREILNLTRQNKATLIVNDRVDVALALEAEGVHLGEEDLPLPLARKIAGPRLIIGATVRTPEKALWAQKKGADYLGAGAIFPSSTKDSAPLIGIETLREIVKAVSIPVVAIGGISLSNLSQVMEAGVKGVAVISSVIGARDITGEAEKFSRVIDEYLRK